MSFIDYPSKYNLLFYTAESYKSNEVRQFTNWVSVPPPSLEITTSSSNIMIRQGEAQTIPARIKSTTGFSNDVINTTVGTTNNDTALSFILSVTESRTLFFPFVVSVCCPLSEIRLLASSS